MKRLYSHLLHQLEQGNELVLVSIIADLGSAPRGAGAQMLVGVGGRIYGSVGGGAVEHWAEAQARQLLENGHPAMVHQFKLRQNEEDDLGTFCGGQVEVLFQPLRPEEQAWLSLARAVTARLDQHGPGFLVSDLSVPGAVPLLWPEDQPGAQQLPPELPPQLTGERPLLIEAAGGRWFAQPLPGASRVLIFGGGHIAQELAPVLARLDFRTLVFENRPEYADPALFPGAEAVICGDYQQIGAALTINPEDYVVVMTNGHSHDLAVEEQALRAAPAYLGVIGSRVKILTINQKLREKGFSQEQLDAVYTPIGTKIMAVTPAELAISIAGQLIMVRAQRRDGDEAGASGCPMH